MTDQNSEDPDNLKDTFRELDPKLMDVFLPWVIRHPRHLAAYTRLSRALKACKRTRVKEGERGLKVPPALILSITSKCNLQCTGCYAHATGCITDDSKILEVSRPSLDLDQWRRIIKEASDLGVFCFVIAGGEPFLFPRLTDIFREFKNRLFLVLTNGTVLGKDDIRSLKRLSNVAVLVSIEGGSELTDSRRGTGVHDKAMGTLKNLNNKGVLAGISVTITRTNFRYWMKPENIDDIIKQGARIGVFVEYIPLTPGSNSEECLAIPDHLDSEENNRTDDFHLILTPDERIEFRDRILNFRDSKPIYLIHSPGDEEYFGGCVSAGRGFAHITPTGDLTPCPISNIATHNLTESSLREALASPLFSAIRENDHLLETEGMPCALFAHPREVDELARNVGAYRTNY
jgi:MoaA/NifB/PqqE/SkfB family radical SAM enzyme